MRYGGASNHGKQRVGGGAACCSYTPDCSGSWCFCCRHSSPLWSYAIQLQARKWRRPTGGPRAGKLSKQEEGGCFLPAKSKGKARATSTVVSAVRGSDFQPFTAWTGQLSTNPAGKRFAFQSTHSPHRAQERSRLTLRPTTVLVLMCPLNILKREALGYGVSGCVRNVWLLVGPKLRLRPEQRPRVRLPAPTPEPVEVVAVEETNLPAAPFVVGPHQRVVEHATYGHVSGL
eukprot:717097-Amphidinium_carterae.1